MSFSEDHSVDFQKSHVQKSIKNQLADKLSQHGQQFLFFFNDLFKNFEISIKGKLFILLLVSFIVHSLNLKPKQQPDYLFVLFVSVIAL